MFEDETVDVKCPKCGHLNSILIYEIEEHAETHFVCVGCKAGVRLEAAEFREHLSHVQNELRQLERDAARQATQGKPPKKDDFQI
jgi:phage FluMu protein Com